MFKWKLFTYYNMLLLILTYVIKTLSYNYLLFKNMRVYMKKIHD